MTTYHILDVTRGTLVQDALGGFITSDDLTQAINSAESLEKVHERSFRHVTAEEYAESVARDKNRLNFALTNYETLKQQVEDFLRDGVDGSTDVDEFIREHRELADAVGFEFLTETTFEITLEVIVKHRMGKTDLEDALDIQVKELYGYGDSGIVDIDITDICIDER